MSLTPIKHGNWHVIDGVLVDVAQETSLPIADVPAVVDEVAEPIDEVDESEPEHTPRSFLDRLGMT